MVQLGRGQLHKPQPARVLFDVDNEAAAGRTESKPGKVIEQENQKRHRSTPGWYTLEARGRTAVESTTGHEHSAVSASTPVVGGTKDFRKYLRPGLREVLSVTPHQALAFVDHRREDQASAVTADRDV
ncbi:hypothetical protein MRX96_017053 [Rhipicephalus microplus]